MLFAGLAFVVLAQEVPVEVPFPGPTPQVWKLVRASDEQEIPAQRVGDSLVFLAKNEKSEYRIAARGPSNFPKVACVDDGKGLTISVSGKKVLRYNHAVIEQPDPVFS